MNPRGFTLVEMLVSVAIFTVVMTLALGALLSMSESDRKAQTLKSVINNFNFALDTMSRTVRTGSIYHCNRDIGTPSTPRDCSDAPGGTNPPSSSFAFQAADLTTTYYCLGVVTSSSASCVSGTLTTCPAGTSCAVLRSLNGAAPVPITASEVKVSTLSFSVRGSSLTDVLQPKVTVFLNGSVEVSSTKTTSFSIQTTITQRVYDQ